RAPAPSAHRKMLAALWRESPVPLVGPTEQLATMAALLHRDADGDAFVTACVRASGLNPQDWVRRYLRAYLAPARPLPAGARARVHAARREPHPGARRARRLAGAHEGHRG